MSAQRPLWVGEKWPIYPTREIRELTGDDGFEELLSAQPKSPVEVPQQMDPLEVLQGLRTLLEDIAEGDRELVIEDVLDMLGFIEEALEDRR